MPGVFTGSHAEQNTGAGITMTPLPQQFAVIVDGKINNICDTWREANNDRNYFIVTSNFERICDVVPYSLPQSSRDKVYESVFTITDNHLIECCNYDDDEVFCNYSGEQCRFTYRNRCKNYKSVIHHQVECDAIQGTHFAQQMVKDAELRSKAGEP